MIVLTAEAQWVYVCSLLVSMGIMKHANNVLVSGSNIEYVNRNILRSEELREGILQRQKSRDARQQK